MKKRILFTLTMVALFVCLLAISISAADMFDSDYTDEVTRFYDTDGVTVLAPEFANVADTEATAVLKKADGAYVRVPVYYIFKASSNNQFNVGGSNFDFSWVSEKLGETEALTVASLAAIEVPYGTTSFSGAISDDTLSCLTELVIPSTVTSLPSKFLRNNEVIKKVFICQEKNEDGTVVGVTTIPDYFADTNTSANLSLEFFATEYDYLTSIGSGAFSKTKIKEIVIKAPITKISGSAFSGCAQLETININNTGDTISTGGKAFAYCVSLKSATLNGISLGDYEFELSANTCTSTGLTVVATNVAKLGTMPFKNFTNLINVDISGPITSVGGSLFFGCANLATAKITNTLDTPATCGNNGFDGLKNLESVTLHGICIGGYMFRNTDGPVDMKITATNVGSIGDSAFYNAENTVEIYVSGPITSVGGSLFFGCANLATAKITNTLDTPATCGNNGFDGLKNLESVTLHGICIGGYMFRNTDGPVDMKITATNVGSIGDSAFYNAENTVEIYVSGPFTSINTGNTFRDCGKLQRLTIINTGDTYVASGNGEVNPELTDLTVKGKVNIGSPAFQKNYKLKNIHLGDGVYEIGSMAFYQCFALETVYLADSIAIIGDKSFDMESAGKQTSAALTFVDENGNMDNYLPTSLTAINGHFLKRTTIANTELIFPKGFTKHTSTQAYDFEGTVYPEGFKLIYLGKMEVINLHCLYNNNDPHDITIYLTNNSASDIKNERINANVTVTDAGTTVAHGEYAGVDTNGTLEIVIDDRLQNNIKVKDYIKFYFCGSNEICFVTRVNILWGTNTSKSWGNFVSTPITYEQLEAAYETYNQTAEVRATIPLKHPIVSAPEYSDASCTEDGGIKTYCLGCGQIASIEKTDDALGHDYDIMNPHSIIYTDLTKDGTYIAECARCFDDIQEIVKDTYLFICLGYSASQTGNGISLGFKVNCQAVNKYTSVANITLKYGVFAVSQSKLGTNDIFDENGNAASGVINAEIARTDFSAFDIKVVGFENDTQKSTKLALGAYVTVTNGDDVEYSYIQANEPLEGAKYSFTSYGEIIK